AELNRCRLLVAGMHGWGGVDLDGPAVEWVGFVQDSELARLYRGARWVAYVPLYEGFRLPVLGALGCGAPVVAGRNEAAGGGRGRRGSPRRPARPGRNRGRRCRGQRTARGAPSARARTSRILQLGGSGARDGRGVSRGGGMTTPPLVVIDADVLGRRRTGDETYVRGLLRELVRVEDLRFAAVTRRPELVPAGIEPIGLPARSQVARMTAGMPRVLRRLRPRLAHFQHALPLGCPCPAIVTVHDLSFERDPSVMGRRDRLIFGAVVPRAA